MDIAVTGRRVTISEDFRGHVVDKLSGVGKFSDRIHRVEVQVTANSRDREGTVDCDITLIGRGPVLRSSALHEDKLHAFDMAYDKLIGQLRRAADRRKGHGRQALRGHPELAEAMLAHLPPAVHPADTGAPEEQETRTIAGDLQVTGDGPLVVREKSFPAEPLTLAQALDEMELLGHDFFLYVDAESQRPSVVYRRKGYSYGVIHLDME